MKTVDLEKVFHHFVSMAEEWRALVAAKAFFHDHSYEERLPVRHVAFICDPMTKERARILQKEWQNFADLMAISDNTARLPIPDSSYLPVPFILEKRTAKTCVKLRTAVRSTLITKEELLRRYDTSISRIEPSAFMDQIKTSLLKERAVFENDDDAETYRVRQPVFNDVIIHQATRTNHRVGTHGAIIFGDNDAHPVPVERFDEYRTFSCYDELQTMKCSVIAHSYVYRTSDIEALTRTITTRNYIKSRIDARLKKFEEAKERILNSHQVNAQNKDFYSTRIKNALDNLELLNKMDEELLAEVAKSNEDLKKLKLRAVRALYGKEIEQRYGVLFAVVNENAKLKVFRKTDGDI